MENIKLRLPRFVLRCDCIRRGDVLLTRASGAEATAISVFSKGDFSHAALFTDPVIIFESDGGLIGFKALRRLGYLSEDGKPVLIYEIPQGPKLNAAVFRHPDFDTVKDRFSEALLAELADSYGKDYSEYYRLVRLAILPQPFTALAKPLVALTAAATRLYETHVFTNQIPGPFCSELVARTYKRLGLSGFGQDTTTDNISPNDLASSILKPVPGAVIDSDVESETIQGFLPNESVDNAAEGVFSPETGDVFAQYRRGQREVERALNQFPSFQSIVEYNKANLRLILSNFRQQISDVEFLLLSSQKVSQAHFARALRVCKQMVVVLADLEAAASQQQPDPQKFKLALTHLTEFGNSLLRANVLLTSQLLKNASAKCTGRFASLGRFRLAWKRRRFLLGARRILHQSRNLQLTRVM